MDNRERVLDDNGVYSGGDGGCDAKGDSDGRRTDAFGRHAEQEAEANNADGAKGLNGGVGSEEEPGEEDGEGEDQPSCDLLSSGGKRQPGATTG